ncbi:amidohydrolase family protein [Polynucleobacter alcilacus]|uniref:amidohydrolase family protein n=1 Tax=Polynucleobacter alcilacus TaxID=1819739 RepID=UPI001C0ADD0B|nr:amidohydrolase family protein [Polynucleobacter alcilacus]MBU3568177.1 amidohydrolase family protein [Polynucleobacter alcilacus]
MIDMFIHPLSNAREHMLFDLSHICWDDWVGITLRSMDENGVRASGVCIMDDRVLWNRDFCKHLEVSHSSKRLWFTLMVNFRADDPLRSIKMAADAGFKGITFHSYLQEIKPCDYSRVVSIINYANSIGMFAGLCTAFGGKGIYDFESLPLAVEILKQSGDYPLVLYHSGGARILEALLLCEMWPNLFLETSFSLSYWLNSSIDLDIAFSIRKIGAKRFMFGSDSPFLPLKNAIGDHITFFEKHGFDESTRKLIFGGSARKVFKFI